MKILLADDDPLIRESLNMVLVKKGHEVILAADGDEALAKAKAGEFDLLITDIFMPGREGPEVVQEVKALYPRVKILAISSDAVAGFSSFLRMMEAVGADATLQKPFTPAQLMQKIDELFPLPPLLKK